MIISTSRRTDIPAYYPDWFMNRIKAVRNQTRETYRRPVFRAADASPHARYKGQKSAVGMRMCGKRRYWRV